MAQRRPRLKQLIRTVHGRSPVLVVAHDYPDPDALASAAALRVLLQRCAKVKCDIAYGGMIGRAENRALVDLLRLPVKPLASVRLERYAAVAIVDFQHTSGNHSLPANFVPDIVIDHHPVQRGSRAVPFHDFWSGVGSTCTILCRYLSAAGIVPDRRLATALTYGIKSETRDLARETQAIDIETYVRLYPLADKRRLAQIEMAPVDTEYYTVLAGALAHARLYGRTLVVTRLGTVPTPDVAAEMADIFLRLNELRCAVAVARCNGQVIVSVRTCSHADNAGDLIQRAFRGRGSAGGHGQMAAGRIAVPGGGDAAYAALERDLIRSFRRLFDVTSGPGRRLVKSA